MLRLRRMAMHRNKNETKPLFAGFASPTASEQNMKFASATWPTSWRKLTNLWRRLEGVILFRHLLRGTDHRIAHKRIETSFACCDRIGRRRR